MSTSNIHAIFNLATPAEIKAGKAWYAEAQEACQSMADRHELPLQIVVGVVAALSPNNRWERNLEDADKLCAAFLNGDAVESVKCCTYHTMRAKAWGILQDGPSTIEEIVKQLKGQKIVAFFRCIMGQNVCCVDGHALNIYRAERHPLTSDKTNVGVRLYRTISDAYAEAGKKHGLKAYEMQAITWTVWRRVHGIA